MRRLCFGGTFNPIHYGHLIVSRSAAESAGFERIVLIPAMQPPHKAGDTGIASPEHRLAMCQLAVADDPVFEVSDIELRRPGPSFTIDTVRQLKSSGWGNLHWLIGADMLRNLPSWHRAPELLAEVQFLLMARPGWSFDWSTMPEPYRGLEKNVVRSPLIDISSTSIRARVAGDRSIAYLTPPTVVEYIEKHKLFR
jgi:nicotinate-nucleotide adenylyltransferase